MNIPSNEFLKAPIINPRYIKKNYPDFYEYLLKTYPNIKSVSEQMYWWKHNITEAPVCPSCGKKLKFYGFIKGYATYCSLKCSNSNSDKQSKTKQTCLKKYGVENPKQCNEIHIKSKQTCLKKYGVENPFASDVIKKKICDTNIQKYGVKYTGSSEEVKEKIRKTIKLRYGVDSVLQLPKTSQNREKSRIKRLKEKYNDFITISENNYIVSCPHKECNKCKEKYYEVSPSCFFDRRRDHTEPCTRILPVGSKYGNSGLEKEIQLFLDSYNINYIENDRTVLKPKEIDIFLPDYNIGIECNGIFTHCSLKKDNNYHKDKTYNCIDKNIQLLHIWEDWIKNKMDIVKSIILSKLGIYKERIYARNCVVKEIDYQKCNKFLISNHIQSKCKSTIKLGLFYNNELVSVMTFGKKDILSGGQKQNNEIVLKRFCNKLYTQVIGGASKLLKYYITHYHPSVIISYSSNDISNGNLYKQLGFIKSMEHNQSYWWIKRGSLERFHRSEFTKADIVKLGWKEKIDDSWTEEEVMYEHGYYKIVDSGQIKWILDLTKTS